jgi:hypothetical protein
VAIRRDPCGIVHSHGRVKMSRKKAGKVKVKENRPTQAPQGPIAKGPQGPMYRGTGDTPLLRAMIRANMSARKLADAMGCSESTVKRWLDGLRPIPHYRACLRALLGPEAMPE